MIAQLGRQIHLFSSLSVVSIQFSSKSSVWRLPRFSGERKHRSFFRLIESAVLTPPAHWVFGFRCAASFNKAKVGAPHGIVPRQLYHSSNRPDTVSLPKDYAVSPFSECILPHRHHEIREDRDLGSILKYAYYHFSIPFYYHPIVCHHKISRYKSSRQ